MYSCNVYYWEWKLYQSIEKLDKSWPPANFFFMPTLQTSLVAFILINFTLFCHFQYLNGICTKWTKHIFIDLLTMWKSYGDMMETLYKWSIVQITYTFWEQFVIRLRTSMILFKTGDSIPLIYSIKCMCGRLLYLLMNLKETFICISHTCSDSTLCDCEVTI